MCEVSNKLEQLIHQIEKNTNRITTKQHNVLVAVSGGADSIGLLCCLAQAKHRENNSINIKVGYVNHAVQSIESQQKEFNVVKNACTQLHVPLYALSIHWQKQVLSQKKSEALLRELRYKNLLHLAKVSDCVYIVSAHHIRDNYEQVCMRMFNYAGWQAMAGMPEVSRLLYQDKIYYTLKPALHMLPESFHSQDIDHHHDVSNDKIGVYTRNTFRNSISPHLEKMFPKAIKNVDYIAQRQKEILHYINNSLPQWFYEQTGGVSISAHIISKLSIAQCRILLYEGANALGITKVSAAFIDECLQKIMHLYHNVDENFVKSNSIERYSTSISFGVDKIRWDYQKKNKIDLPLDLENMPKNDYSCNSEPHLCASFVFRDRLWCREYVEEKSLPLSYNIFLEAPLQLGLVTKHCWCEVLLANNNTGKLHIKDVLVGDTSMWNVVPVIKDALGTAFVIGESFLARTIIASRARHNGDGKIPVLVKVGYRVFSIEYKNYKKNVKEQT